MDVQSLEDTTRHAFNLLICRNCWAKRRNARDVIEKTATLCAGNVSRPWIRARSCGHVPREGSVWSPKMVETWQKTRAVRWYWKLSYSFVAFSGARQADFHHINLEMVAPLLPHYLKRQHCASATLASIRMSKPCAKSARELPQTHASMPKALVIISHPRLRFLHLSTTFDIIDEQQAYFRRARVFSLFQSLTVLWRDRALTRTFLLFLSFLSALSPQTYFTLWPCVVDLGWFSCTPKVGTFSWCGCLILPLDTPTNWLIFQVSFSIPKFDPKVTGVLFGGPRLAETHPKPPSFHSLRHGLSLDGRRGRRRGREQRRRVVQYENPPRPQRRHRFRMISAYVW